ncbi:MAG: shikimate dehydrogenase [Candidatus Omnitrophota bacterium]
MKRQIFGLFGYPVGHSLSAAMHNAAFKYLKMNAKYMLFEVPPSGLRQAADGILKFGIKGVNVTIPHKESIIDYLDAIDEAAKLIGAVNTIVVKKGRLIGYNTDGYGFLQSLKQDLKFSPKGRSVFILGSGGAAKAVAFGLAKAGAGRIVLSDIDDGKAIRLANRIKAKIPKCDCIAVESSSMGRWELLLNSQLLVNATPCGMRKGDPMPVPAESLRKGLSVFDLVYNRNTELLKSSRRKGLKAADGLGMLLHQGAGAFNLWTGKKAPVKVMSRALKAANK